ncbi:hypothetical protein [Gimesia panareensis]|uniref:hypothetical protein n=1 Tax=Gimesia panareensis TaxID=2527978 RepID=UPI001189EA8D|nr:hypothetical protein [Gimesia panareensis]QDU53477.1 hypothetical protein Pan110_58690 [Gimesia panareensis]
MARCDQGYLCIVCGEEVDNIEESALYLRYIIGEVREEELQEQPEYHIRCNPALAQFIVDAEFEPVSVEGTFDKRELDPAETRLRETLVTKGWNRLKIVKREQLSVSEFPLKLESDNR